MSNDVNTQCPECDGVGLSCGRHDRADGCDCEDGDRVHECATCHGTGVLDEDDEDI
jgi:hypothetical protein